jgi:hypothetical protein
MPETIGGQLISPLVAPLQAVIQTHRVVKVSVPGEEIAFDL